MTEEIKTTEQPPVKTAITILTDICAALENAENYCREDTADNKARLRLALDNLPPADVNTLLQHIQSMYSACEGMKITRVAFRCDVDGKRIVCIIGIQFGIREIELFAPFDSDAGKEVLKELIGSLNLLEPSRIILPGEGNA